MTATIAVYHNQGDALSAVNALKGAGYPPNHLSILGHAAEDSAQDEDNAAFPELGKPMKIAATGMGIGAVVGPILGALAGLGLIAIPGVGFLYGAGALAGAVAGLDAGLIGGGIFSALAIAQTSSHHEEKYGQDLKAGRYIVVAQGSEEEVKHAREILTELDIHHDLETYL